jgi:hypothetical protein
MTAVAPASEAAGDALPPATASLQAQLDALCAAGAARVDPVAVRTLRAIVARLPGQTWPVQRVLHERAGRALQALARRVQDAPVAADPAPRRTPPRAAKAEPTPLAQLAEALRAAASRSTPTNETRSIAVRDELPSVERFRRAWGAVRAQEQVAQGVARIPTHAGPLNSHALVLQTLSLMQALSPEYLAHFLRHVESLQWLEQSQVARATAVAKSTTAAKATRRAAARKK